MAKWLKAKEIEIDDHQVVEPISVPEGIQILNLYDYQELDSDDPERTRIENDVEKACRDARSKFEEDTGHTFAERGFALYCERPTAPELALPVYPVQEVVSIFYLDPAGELQEWDSEQWQASVGEESLPATLRPKPGYSWPPMLCCTARALQLNVLAGYPPDEMPTTAVRAMKMMLTHLWNNDGVTSLRATHKMPHAYDTIMYNYMVEV